ncbi:fimbrial protein [Enterobacter bugandensis]|uniref:fimbrial protein n=1 Tax=Enterobacter bugandensis TaxID=881260 RepID=UPI0010A45609|nr:fimbrial protein [Enterobacter bugandensis]MCK7148448.1 fimbrial protein [Enterobacter bugandensis]THE50166.1 type 1 fimbrial protein [Enterobacter bugandensis]
MKKINLLILCCLGLVSINSASAADNVHLTGALVSEPCTLPDSDTALMVDFGTVDNKTLYKDSRSKSVPFYLHLNDCDTTSFDSLTVTFEGSQDAELLGYLALDTASAAHGIAIGMEMTDGTLIPINKASSVLQLSQGNNIITFNSFIQAQQTAISNKSIVVGGFSATSTFVLNYQ